MPHATAGSLDDPSGNLVLFANYVLDAKGCDKYALLQHMSCCCGGAFTHDHGATTWKADMQKQFSASMKGV